MHDSVKFVAAFLLAGALATPPSLLIQHLENEGEARTLAVAATGGDPDRGKQAARVDGCGACHNIPGVSGARGEVGPKLAYITQRAELAGRLPNDPAILMNWIRHPQQMSPGSGMPEMGLREQDVRDIAAYLYTLRAG